jgi:transposase
MTESSKVGRSVLPEGDALLNARPRKYPPKLVGRGARLTLESGLPIAHVAADIGVPSDTLRKHIRRLEVEQGLASAGPTPAEREEVKALKREVAELRRANEILRAASLFFANELDDSRAGSLQLSSISAVDW